MARLVQKGGSVVAAPGHVGDVHDADRMTRKAIDELGQLDLLVNNAATPATAKAVPPADLDLLTEDMWSTTLIQDLKGVFYCTRAAASALKGARGAVVNTASISGIDAVGTTMAYSAAKAGVINLTKNLARALAPEVRVNAIAPGAVDSPWMVQASEDQKRQSIEKALLKRRCSPDDLAEVIVFLGVAAAMITGQTVIVDGGLSLG